MTPVSVLVCCSGCDTRLLPRCLAAVMAQEDCLFDVTVVLQPDDELGLDCVKRLEMDNAILRHLVLPSGTRFIGREQLMYSLAIRTVRYDVVAVTHCDCLPQSRHWLDEMAHAMTDSVDVVMGYADYETPSFTHVWRQMTAFSLAARHPYRIDPRNMMLRKSAFLDSGGMAPFSYLKSGVFQLWANTQKRAAVAHTLVFQSDEGSRYEDDERLAWMETRRHLRHTFPYRSLFFLDILLHYALLAAAIVTAILFPAYFYIPVLFCILAAAALTWSFNRRAKVHYARHSGWTVAPRKLAFPFTWLLTRIDYAFTPRRLFFKDCGAPAKATQRPNRPPAT